MSIPGFYGLLYVPSKLIVRGEPAATARNIAASETLFRAGIVADLFGTVGFIFVALALYRLFEGVGRRAAAAMVVLIIVSVPMSFVGELQHLALLPLLDKAGAAFDEAQRNALIAMHLKSFDQAILVNEIFWGLWLFPLAWLIARSGFLPRLLGALVLVAGLAWVVESFTFLLLPAYARAVAGVTSRLRTLELALPLWLLIFGAKDRPLPE
jgi:hypothetical protein